jgi:hypothetical protein
MGGRRGIKFGSHEMGLGRTPQGDLWGGRRRKEDLDVEIFNIQ